MDTNINIRTSKDLKKDAEEIFKALGINMSIAINMFLNECVRVNGLPLELRLYTPDKETIKEANLLYKREIRKREKGKHVKGIITDDKSLKKSLGV